MMRCEYCGITFNELFALAAIRALGARVSGGRSSSRCLKAPRVQKRGSRGGIKYVREHRLVEDKVTP